ncbi:hypothetical protein [Leptospira ryugenii]|nr:hypothetical protein [Leptospira ryugenii]
MSNTALKLQREQRFGTKRMHYISMAEPLQKEKQIKQKEKNSVDEVYGTKV